MRTLLAAFALSIFAVTVSTVAEAAVDPQQAAADYAQMQKWQFSSAPIAVPSAGLVLTSDTAVWTLQSGEIRLMQPTSSGRITGLVFEGKGRFQMTVPDPIELAQLRRFTGKPELTSIDEPITQLVFRASDDRLNRLFPNASTAFTTNGLAQKRQEHWLIDYRWDIDAEVLGAMLNPDALSVTADMNTQSFDWISYNFDSRAPEEIQLVHFYRGFPESWLSIDRAEDRLPSGRPGETVSQQAKMTNLDVRADLTRYGSTGEIGTNHQRTINGHYVIDETYTTVKAGLNVLTFELDPTAQNLTVADEESHPLVYLRDHIGKRAAAIDNKVWDSDIAVILPSPLKAGETRHLVFTYDLETANYAGGDSWYPTVRGPAFLDAYTARLDLIVNKRNAVRSMGRLEKERETEKGNESVWIVDRPTKMVTFSTADRFEEVKVEVNGIPTVVSFGPSYQFGNTDKMRNVGADVANSLQFFQNLFDDRVGGQQFFVTSIAAGHGQAFDGFLHMSEYTYEGEHPGASELFRAHEVAHEWWGHKVGWKSYRDQWLSESFAEYSSMMFVEGFVKGGPKFFEEILDTYDSLVKGNLGGGFSKFNRPGLVELSPTYRARLGPISDGYRAGTGDIPTGYQIQTYHKGPLVLHMLRMLLRYKAGNDQLFIKILRDFEHDYSGKAASTADFRKVVERDAPGDWGWFFDAWIDHAYIPTYVWSYKSEPAEKGAYKLTMHITRSEVPDNFFTVIPIRVELEGGKAGSFFVTSKGNVQDITQIVPSRPTKVIFAPEHSLLANIKHD